MLCSRRGIEAHDEIVADGMFVRLRCKVWSEFCGNFAGGSRGSIWDRFWKGGDTPICEATDYTAIGEDDLASCAGNAVGISIVVIGMRTGIGVVLYSFTSAMLRGRT